MYYLAAGTPYLVISQSQASQFKKPFVRRQESITRPVMLLLKSARVPLLSTFPANPRTLRQTILIPSRASSTQSPPPVRQNASLNPPTTFLPPASAYIHLPFCRKRCHYCDFPIVALGSANPTDSDPRIANYVQLLRQEIVSTRAGFEHHPPLETVFFGGGTPSLVSPNLVSSILDTLRAKFGISDDAEISMEMDPGTFDGRKLKDMMGLGVNRVSLGVQSFQEQLLTSCGRAHGIKEVYDAIQIVGSCGVQNWSLDLISSLPHQTHEMWEESLRLAVDSHPHHVSVYDLQVEQDTKFGLLYSPGEFPLPSETQSADFYRMASKMLTEAGYTHYEISSYAKDGYECKHNSIYWKTKPFYGFGLGSASYVNGLRFSRPKKMKEYAAFVQNLESGVADLNPSTDAKDLALDVVMLSLRTARGLDLRSFAESFGGSMVSSLCKVYKPYVDSGHVICLDKERRSMDADELNKLMTEGGDQILGELGFIRLSDPDGFLLSNELISLAFRAIAP
ncbi:Heme chaperone HemW [Linum grandiflorum]